MRIIDKNTDFYDFYQNIYRDNSLVFDRRDSYVLTKEYICNNLYLGRHWSINEKRWVPDKKTYILLQVCNTFWLFKMNVTKINNFDRPEDYTIELLSSWRNFNKERKLISLEAINFNYFGYRIEPTIKRMIDAVDKNDYKVKQNFNYYTFYRGHIDRDREEVRHIPILKASGLAPYIDAHEIYLAFEEYFSLEKSDSERREPLGTTDIDKVESHGFDKKTSFRGK